MCLWHFKYEKSSTNTSRFFARCSTVGCGPVLAERGYAPHPERLLVGRGTISRPRLNAGSRSVGWIKAELGLLVIFAQMVTSD